MKRKILYFLLFSCVFFLVKNTRAIIAADTAGLDEVMKEAEIKKEFFLPQIEEIMSQVMPEKDAYNDSNSQSLNGPMDYIVSYDVENAYRVSLLEPLLVTSVKEGGSFQSAITNQVQWKIPCVNNKEERGLVFLTEENGVLNYVGHAIGEASVRSYITDEMILSAVEQSEIKKEEITSMQIAYSPIYYTTFVYITTKEEEYLIPYSGYAEEVKINNGEVYRVSRLMKLWNRCFDEKKIIEAPGSYGGVPFRQTFHKPFVLCITAAAISVIMLLVLFFWERRRKKTQL